MESFSLRASRATRQRTRNTATPGTAEGKVDGRRERTSKTRSAIIDAVIALQESGEVRATAAAIVARAGVSLRSLFVHFPQQEELTLAVMQEIDRRMLNDLVSETPKGALPARLDAFLARRLPLLERLVAYRRSAATLEPQSDKVRARRRAVRRRMRDEVGVVFAPEIAMRPGHEREALLHALAITLDSEAWDNLRRQFSMTRAKARSTLRLAVLALLS